jgi:hypothetical protein
MKMTALPEPTRTLICEKQVCLSKGPTTFYVHLDNGYVATVADVTGLEVTDREIVFSRGTKTPVSYRRHEVYYACCEKDDEPPSLF